MKPAGRPSDLLTADNRHLESNTKSIGLPDPLQRYRHLQFQKWQPASILDFGQPEVDPFDLPSRKSYLRIKHEVDWTTRSRDNVI